MKGFNELLFVVECHRGATERNILYTKDEFLSHLEKLNCGDFIEDIRVLLNNPKTAFRWKSLTLEGATLDFRVCRGERDLQGFLRGAYNDSLVKMAARGLGPVVREGGFHWENAVHAFSPRARYLYGLYTRSVAQRAAAEERGYVPLDQRIQLCQRESAAGGFSAKDKEAVLPAEKAYGR